MGKVGLKSFLTITVVAILGIVLFKVVFTKVNIPGVSTVVQAV